ncbi:MAG: hypothetical protein N0C84_00665 [Candidatus Thiodiazotropha taylori]|uniref:Uncharacterized protein n=1 Tax=Candidatus Thiodiazotropha taylori TaxID=2792791 RepID=A0A9E4K9F9_9GAMM|nr:hypothetical protein [Candidatus Thiodiazotropha taylori]MCW4254957.1 hypothetical protein [Candidatus Thiodiazotropha taylori]
MKKAIIDGQEYTVDENGKILDRIPHITETADPAARMGGFQLTAMSVGIFTALLAILGIIH